LQALPSALAVVEAFGPLRVEAVDPLVDGHVSAVVNLGEQYSTDPKSLLATSVFPPVYLVVCQA